MFLKTTKTWKGRIYLQIVEGFRNEEGKASHRVVERLGYLDVLDPLHDGKAIEYYKQYAKDRTTAERVPKSISISLNNEMIEDASSLKNVGYLALKPIYKKLRLSDLCGPFSAKYNTDAETLDQIFQFLLYSKVIDASSKISSYNKISQYFENYSFSEHAMYRALSVLGNSWEQIKDYTYKTTNEVYGLDLTKTYYDGTNFYFEIDRENEFQRKGPAKDNRTEPLVAVGLLLDSNYLPIDICIYPGNESEKPHYCEVIKEMKAKNKISGKTVFIADKGLNYGQSIYEIHNTGNGYIFSQSVKMSKDAIKKYITNPTGFVDTLDKYGDIVYRIKGSIDDECEIEFTTDEGRKKHNCKQLQVVTWSREYANKTRYEREKLIKKAKSLIKSPKKFDKARVGDAASYVEKIVYNSKGEIVEDRSILSLNHEKIKAEEEFDGYYMIVTSELHMKPEEVVNAYRNLSNIERSFRVQKHYLNLRPVYLSRHERIKAHVLISYLSLLMLRILERKILKDKFPIEQIIEALRDYNCAAIKQNIYFFFKYNKVIEELGKLSGSNVKLETQTLSSIKKIFKYKET